ncbi:hypothetical protein E2C01_073586 [Portunus trituberculatus]|uniref:Uncharacterized protein n=1 Tax=Portunus trituberculatus TaxID=210409 RepID=A0A5B7IEB7_PORTR|nr:hypothetical protein [Portunus trituberculatus]
MMSGRLHGEDDWIGQDEDEQNWVKTWKAMSKDACDLRRKVIHLQRVKLCVRTKRSKRTLTPVWRWLGPSTWLRVGCRNTYV